LFHSGGDSAWMNLRLQQRVATLSALTKNPHVTKAHTTRMSRISSTTWLTSTTSTTRFPCSNSTSLSGNNGVLHIHALTIGEERAIGKAATIGTS
jgi:hypothetical protein